MGSFNRLKFGPVRFKTMACTLSRSGYSRTCSAFPGGCLRLVLVDNKFRHIRVVRGVSDMLIVISVLILDMFIPSCVYNYSQLTQIIIHAPHAQSANKWSVIRYKMKSGPSWIGMHPVSFVRHLTTNPPESVRTEITRGDKPRDINHLREGILPRRHVRAKGCSSS